MKWNHTLAIVAAILLISGIVSAVAPIKGVAIQMPEASDMGKCAPGPQSLNCIDNVDEVPTWHYQDGGTAAMNGGGGGGGSLQSAYDNGNEINVTGSPFTLKGVAPLTFKNAGGTAIANVTTSGSVLSFYDPTSWTGFDIDGLSTNIWGKDFAAMTVDGVGMGLTGRDGVGGPSWNIGSTDAPVGTIYGNSDGSVQINALGVTYVHPLNADGASALAFKIDTYASWSTPGAKLISAGTGGAEMMSVDKDGKIVAPAIGTSSAAYHALPSGTGDLASLDATQTFTNKTYSAPIFSGTATGTYTLGGTPTLGANLEMSGNNTLSVGSATNNIATVHARAITSNSSFVRLNGVVDVGTNVFPVTDNAIGLGTSTNRWAAFYTRVGEVYRENMTTTATEGRGLFLHGTPLTATTPGSAVTEYSPLLEFGQSYGQSNDAESGYATARMALQGRITQDIGGSSASNRLVVLSDNGTGTYSEVASFRNNGSLVSPSAGTSTSALHAFPSGTGDLVSVDATQTESNKTFTAPVINGLTSSGSTSIDFSGNSGTFKTTTGAHTFGSASWAIPANTVITGSASSTNTVGLNLTTNVADGASSIGMAIDNTTTLANATAKILSLKTGGTEKIYFRPNRLQFSIGSTIDGDGLILTGGTNPVHIGATSGGGVDISNTDISPSSDNAMLLGGTGNRFNKLVASYWYGQKQGAQLTAAATITPTSGQHHVTGATTIDTIAITNVPAPGTNVMNATLTIFADGGTITWSAAGNIKSAGTLAQDKSQRFTYDVTNSKWYPEQFLFFPVPLVLLPFIPLGFGAFSRRRSENDNSHPEARKRLSA